MSKRFTLRAKKVMELADQEARRFSHEFIGTEHILLGIVKEGGGVGANALKNLDVDLRKVRIEVEKLVKPGPDVVGGKLHQTPRAKMVITHAIKEATTLKHDNVGTEHLLLGVLQEYGGVGAQVLQNMGLKPEEVREEVFNLLNAGVENDGPASPEEPRAGTMGINDGATPKTLGFADGGNLTI